MEIDKLFQKAIALEPLDNTEGEYLYRYATLDELMQVANTLRKIHIQSNNVGWIIDRNVNITNVCFSQCSFCNFCRKKNDKDCYVTSIDEYKKKIDELYLLGGDQLLLQGGMNPKLDINFYSTLFRELKSLYPNLKLHALGPPEIVFIARQAKLSYKETLETLMAAGLDSLPGAGAEILSDRVRKILSPAKATVSEWLGVMEVAHQLNLPTSATMMYGHIETIGERINHLILLRELQSKKPKDNWGFITFIPWPYKDQETVSRVKYGIKSTYNGHDYLKMIAISRIMLNNIPNIQTSVLTTGRDIGMISLHAGANDVGSIMIEENVVSSAGSRYQFNAQDLQDIIQTAGFVPIRRNQKYEPYPC